MAYTCPTCSGTGKVSGFLCPTCNGHKTLVEDSQGLSISWGAKTLGSLRSFRFNSAVCEVDDVTNMTSTVVTHAPKSYGMIRHLMPGDITPGTVDLSWIGDGSLTQADIGQVKPLHVVRAGRAPGIDETFNAILLSYDANYSVGDTVTGSAKFQLTGT